LERPATSVAKKAAEPKSSPDQSERTVTDLNQIRALADPLRLRILGALARTPRTTKQVAGLLGEKPTKLYHHVETLERLGLVRLIRTRPKRGTVEKYYQAVAGKFRIAASALRMAGSESAGATDEVEAMLSSILDSARADLSAHLAAKTPRSKSNNDAPLVGRVIFRGPEKTMQQLRRRLLRMIEELRETPTMKPTSVKKPGEQEPTYALTVVLCRTDAAAGN